VSQQTNGRDALAHSAEVVEELALAVGLAVALHTWWDSAYTGVMEYLDLANQRRGLGEHLAEDLLYSA
jgi:hypothetical protein